MKSCTSIALPLFVLLVALAGNSVNASRIRGATSSTRNSLIDEEFPSETSSTGRGLRENPKSSARWLKDTTTSSFPSPVPTQGDDWDPDRQEARDEKLQEISSSPSPLPTKGNNWDPNRFSQIDDVQNKKGTLEGNFGGSKYTGKDKAFGGKGDKNKAKKNKNDDTKDKAKKDKDVDTKDKPKKDKDDDVNEVKGKKDKDADGKAKNQKLKNDIDTAIARQRSINVAMPKTRANGSKGKNKKIFDRPKASPSKKDEPENKQPSKSTVAPTNHGSKHKKKKHKKRW